jgi:hypothetical protein
MTRDLRPSSRFEWEQILRRTRKTGLISGSGKLGEKGLPTKGGVSGAMFLAVALTLASYGNLDGGEIFPGDAAIATDLECSMAAVSKVRAKLAAIGFIQRVRGPKATRGEEWRLTIPVDLVEHVDVLSPTEHRAIAKQTAEARRGKNHTSGRRAGGPSGTPARTEPNPDPGDPVVPPVDLEGVMSGGPTGSHQNESGGPTGSQPGDPLGALTKPVPDQQEHPANSDGDVDLDAHHPREAASSSEDHDSAEVVDIATRRCPHNRSPRSDRGVPRCPECRAEAEAIPVPEPTPAVKPPAPVNVRPSGCSDHPAMKAGTRGDGLPHCPLCRALARPRSKEGATA